MARVKISEFRAKKLLASTLGFKYEGVSFDLASKKVKRSLKLLPNTKLVVKVDQAVKKRNQKGLVTLNRSKSEASKDLANFAKQGFRYALVEPMIVHDAKAEHFLALVRTEQGVEIHYSEHGGVNVEDHSQSVRTQLITAGKRPRAIGRVSAQQLQSFLDVFNKTHMVYLEINPLVVIQANKLLPLDAAVEVDSAADFVVGDQWTSDDYRTSQTSKTVSEKQVEQLQATSSASLSLRVLNQNGKLFLLLSGGGASVVIADEFSTYGLTNELANYGEYSGNPNEDELFHYTDSVIQLMKKSKSKSKILVIAGGVANFTDINVTFKGIIKAINKHKKFFKDHHVVVFVRRGGPNQEQGLKNIQSFLNSLEVVNHVHGPELPIGQFVAEVAKAVEK